MINLITQHHKTIYQEQIVEWAESCMERQWYKKKALIRKIDERRPKGRPQSKTGGHANTSQTLKNVHEERT